MPEASGKDALRAHYKQLREGIAPDQRARIDLAITRTVLALPAFGTSDVVLTYLSFGPEVNTREIINQAWRDGKKVALPRVVEGTRTMRWYLVYGLDGLEKSPFGVEEPPENPLYELDLAQAYAPLALVPGLAFDAQGYRLGYGGGFYDTFLKNFEGISVGLCREAQLLEKLDCTDKHDLPVNLVVTEAQVLSPNQPQ